jgi:methyl-accepting chemotaxis protein
MLITRGSWLGRRSFGSSLEVEVSAYLPALRQLATQLAETSHQVETAVTHVCGTFQDMVERAQTGLAHAEAITASGERGQGAALLDTLAGARQAFDVLLDRLTSASGRARDAADRVQRLRELAAGVEKGIAKVDSIAMSVRLLALNAKIEAARDGDRGAGFSVVASEMERCAGESSEIADSIQETAHELTSTLNSVAGTLRAEADRASADMDTSRRAIEEALRDVERTHDAIRTHLTEAGRMNRDFTRDISAAVVALQFQDRVSQRVGHVIDGLGRMHDALAAALPSLRGTDQRVARRREEIEGDLASAHTMREERQAAAPVAAAVAAQAPAEAPAASGDVELF